MDKRLVVFSESRMLHNDHIRKEKDKKTLSRMHLVLVPIQCHKNIIQSYAAARCRPKDLRGEKAKQKWLD